MYYLTPSRYKKNRLAFTLAEVLVTLAIVGVLASLTIPTLLNNTNESQYNTAVKKIYSELSQAIMTIQNNNGTVQVGTAAATADTTLVRSDFCSVMTCIKQDNATNIFGATTDYKYYKGGSIGWPGSGETNSAATLNNGNHILFIPYANCTTGGVNACASIYVDINGSKGPNMLGKDWFAFFIVLNNGVYSMHPIGTSTDGQSCVAGSSTWGTSNGCTYQRLMNPDAMP